MRLKAAALFLGLTACKGNETDGGDLEARAFDCIQEGDEMHEAMITACLQRNADEITQCLTLSRQSFEQGFDTCIKEEFPRYNDECSVVFHDYSSSAMNLECGPN